MLHLILDFSTNNVFYKFLGFVKILNITLSSGPTQINWINNNLDNAIKIKPCAQDSLKKLSSSNIGKEIYERERCAIAYVSGNDRSIDPDNPTEKRRINEALPLMQALAQYFIEAKLGIKTIKTIRDEHLFELAGFKQKLDKKLLAKITIGKDLGNINALLEEKFRKDFLLLSFKIRRSDNEVNSNLFFNEVKYVQKGNISIRYASLNQQIAVELQLDFFHEKVEYDRKSSFRAKHSEDLVAYHNIIKQA